MPDNTPDPRRWKALWIIAVAQFLVIMDTSIIGVALPDIQRALGFSQADLSWVFNAYVVAFGGLLLLGGKLSDVFGPRRSSLPASVFSPPARWSPAWPTPRRSKSRAARSRARARR